MSHGKVRQFTWTHDGQKRRAWGFTVTIDGKRSRRQGYGSRAEAQAALDAMKHPTPASAPVSSITLAEAFTRYFDVKRRKRSLDEDRRIAKQLMAEFGEMSPLIDITASRISAYKASLLAVKKSRRGAALSAASINRPLAVIRHLLRLAHEEWEVLPAVPRIKLEREQQGRLRWLTPEEATRLLTKCREQKNPALVDLVELALYTGMRQGELLSLNWGSVDRSRGVVLLEVTKSGRRREVPLNGPADAVLARRAGDGKAEELVFGTTSWDAFRKHWEAALEAAKLEDFHFHDLRHTFASWAVQRGATLPEVKDLLGHATLAMVMRYAHLAPEHLCAAVSRLDDVMVLSSSGRNRAEQAETLIPSKS
jgi:integrase